jgi:hypothetical protein
LLLLRWQLCLVLDGSGISFLILHRWWLFHGLVHNSFFLLLNFLRSIHAKSELVRVRVDSWKTRGKEKGITPGNVIQVHIHIWWLVLLGLGLRRHIFFNRFSRCKFEILSRLFGRLLYRLLDRLFDGRLNGGIGRGFDGFGLGIVRDGLWFLGFKFDLQVFHFGDGVDHGLWRGLGLVFDIHRDFKGLLGLLRGLWLLGLLLFGWWGLGLGRRGLGWL